MSNEYIAVEVDDEYNAEIWWDALRAAFPRFAKSLAQDGVAVIAAPLWGALSELPGFEGGPAYAPNPIIDCGSEGSRWAMAVAAKHGVFDTLS